MLLKTQSCNKKREKAVLHASVLPAVLVAGALLLLAAAGVFLLWDMHSWQAAAYHRERQSQLYVESGFALYAADGAAGAQMLNDPDYRLFDEDQNSRLRTERYLWGLYEVVAVTAATDGKTSSIGMFGKANPGPEHPALWICDSRKSVSFAGTTALFGVAYVPDDGLRYAQMYSRSFEGKQLEAGQIRASREELPTIDPEILEYTRTLWQLPEERISGGDLSAKMSFREPVLCVGISGGRFDGNVSGHVVLKGDRMIVGRESRLSDVLIVAASVKIESGFRGKVQIFARDSVVVEEGAMLEYPSGICLNGETPDGYVKLADRCEVNGYVVVEGTAPMVGRPKARYIQHEGAHVRGLLRVDGIAQVQGDVTGSTWLRESYYIAPEGYYANIVYNARFFATDVFPYPRWQEGPYERRCVQWLY